jgi:hypothetical protein
MNNTMYHTQKNPDFHISKAERNESFYNSLNLESCDFNEWAVIVLFYVILHYVDAVLSQDGMLGNDLREPENHYVRNRAVSQCSLLSPIARNYYTLYNRSMEARYEKFCFSDGYLQKLKENIYAPTHKYLRKQLGCS